MQLKSQVPGIPLHVDLEVRLQPLWGSLDYAVRLGILQQVFGVRLDRLPLIQVVILKPIKLVVPLWSDVRRRRSPR